MWVGLAAVTEGVLARRCFQCPYHIGGIRSIYVEEN